MQKRSRCNGDLPKPSERNTVKLHPNLMSLLILFLMLSCSDPGKKPQAGEGKITVDPKCLNDSTLVLDQQYQKTVFGFIRAKTLELLSSDTALQKTDNRWNEARVKVVLEQCTDPSVRDFWLYVVVKDQLENYTRGSSNRLSNAMSRRRLHHTITSDPAFPRHSCFMEPWIRCAHSRPRKHSLSA